MTDAKPGRYGSAKKEIRLWQFDAFVNSIPRQYIADVVKP